MAFTNRYRPDLPAGPIQDAFDALYAQLRSFVGVSFNEDGTLQNLDLTTGRTPVGGIMPYGGASAPSAWLMCDGSQVNRVTYAGLFAVIGTAYGVGDGSTTFNLPDLRQRFPLGKATAGTGATLGSTGGNIDHTHTGGTISGSTASDGAHTHSISGSTANESSHTHAQGAHQHAISAVDRAAPDVNGVEVRAASTQIGINNDSGTGPGSAHSHGAGTLAAASGGSHTHGAGTLAISSTGSANPPYAVVNYIIYAGV